MRRQRYVVFGGRRARRVRTSLIIVIDKKQNKVKELARENLNMKVNVFDNVKHKSAIVIEWLKKNVPNILEFPPQSPDLNVIEHLWEELDQRLRKSKASVAITDKKSLKEALKKNWADITSDITENLVMSMPRRLQAVIDAKGGSTKY
ncbi:unnamed protein product [Euphydryas editha]|uniref:Tc1-like transposase DDE domain-containing protein n=1 Tax=Euphydryas editha TaxID=104508 RepID=A0AAU9TUV8_EUPED|nr:unnamed protein product [Euphydryas editha]